MAEYFFDTSAFAKYYHWEPGSEAVAAIFAEPDRMIRVSDLGVLETQSVFAMKVRIGEIVPQAAILHRLRMFHAIATGSVSVNPIRQDHLTLAGHLIANYGFKRQLKTVDALQLAIVLDLRTRGLVDTFVVADNKLAEVARAEGLNVLVP